MKTAITLERGVAFLEDGTEVSNVSLEMIKAAPLMLKALKHIVNDVPSPGEDAELTATGYNMACAAIQAAEGEES